MASERNPHCQIGKVKFKSGTNLRVFTSKSPYTSSAIRRELVSNARDIHEYVPDMCGYVIVAWRPDGTFSRGLRNGHGSPVSATMLPSFIADLLRRSWKEPNE
jgi:hypothetical protein